MYSTSIGWRGVAHQHGGCCIGVGTWSLVTPSVGREHSLAKVAACQPSSMHEQLIYSILSTTDLLSMVLESGEAITRTINASMLPM